MTDLFAQQQHPQHCGTSSSPIAPQHSISALPHLPWQALDSNMQPSGHFDAGAQQQPQHHQYPYQQFSSPAGPSSSRSNGGDATPTAAAENRFLPHQAFSSPTDNVYPASTLAAVEATRARFFAQQSGSRTTTRNGSRSAPRTRPTPTGSTLMPRGQHRAHKAHTLSSSSSASYRQSFFDRCQHAMDQSRASQRQQRITSFRKGADAFDRNLFSDDMEVEDDESALASSPPESAEREEDDELTRHRILAEYSRLKRIYELKGHLEIGWIDPDQLSWLESEVGREQEVDDPYWAANDEQLEQLWRDSLSSSQQTQMQAGGADEFDVDDAAFEEELARLPV